MSSRNQAWKKIRLLKAIICHFFGRMFHEKTKLTQDEEAILTWQLCNKIFQERKLVLCIWATKILIEILSWKFCSNFRDKFASEYKYKLKMILKVMTQSKNYASTLRNPLDYNNWCIMVIWSQKTDMMCKPACWCYC